MKTVRRHKKHIIKYYYFLQNEQKVSTTDSFETEKWPLVMINLLSIQLSMFLFKKKKIILILREKNNKFMMASEKIIHNLAHVQNVGKKYIILT